MQAPGRRGLPLARAGDSGVTLTGRSVDALGEVAEAIEDKGGAALVAPADVTVAADLQRMAEATCDRFGAIDALVANSGVGGLWAPLWELDQSDWEHTMAVNVTGVFLSCRAVLSAMIERGTGSIVVLGSMTGKRPLTGRTPYAASKTALIGLVRTLAAEVGAYGVRVNLVSPGAVEGDRIEWVIRKQAEARGVSFDEAQASFTAASPLQRLLTAEEVAEAVAFLVSDRAAAITGEDLTVSAGTVMY